jgi:hypothetical protein
MKGMSYPLPAAGPVPDAASRHTVTLLFRDRHAELVRLAVLLLGSRPAAEDVVQDVFTRLCTSTPCPAAGPCECSTTSSWAGGTGSQAPRIS